MTITVDDKDYAIRSNYLHRGQNPRLVLEHKEDGGFVTIQFDNNDLVVSDMDCMWLADISKSVVVGESEQQRSYAGYWVTRKGHKEVRIKFKEH